jgi:hypothetical protein
MSHYIGVASVISIFAPLTVTFFPKVNKEVPVTLIVLLVASFLSDATNCIADYFLELKIYWITNIYSILQYFIIALLYYKTYFVSVTHRRLIVAGSSFFLVASVVKTIVDPIGDMHYTSLWSVSCFLIIIYSIVYLNDVFRRPPVENIVTYGQFWINAALFYYFMLNAFFYFLADKILKEPLETSELLWAFHSLNNLIKNILLAVGIYYLARPRKKQIVYTGVIKMEDPKVEEVQLAYQRLRSMSVSEAEIVKEILGRWQDDHNGRATPGTSI